MEPHVNEEDLELYAMGRLQGDLITCVENHLLITCCNECKERLKETSEYIRTLQEAMNSERFKKGDPS